MNPHDNGTTIADVRQFLSRLDEIPEWYWASGSLHFKFDEKFDLTNFHTKYPTSTVVCLGGLPGWEYFLQQQGNANLRQVEIPELDEWTFPHPGYKDETKTRKKSIAWGYVILVDAETEARLDQEYLGARDHKYVKVKENVYCLDKNDFTSVPTKSAFFYHDLKWLKEYQPSPLEGELEVKKWRLGLIQLRNVGNFLRIRMDIIEILRRRPQREDEEKWKYYSLMSKHEFEFDNLVLIPAEDLNSDDPDLLYLALQYSRHFPTTGLVWHLPPGPNPVLPLPPPPPPPPPRQAAFPQAVPNPGGTFAGMPPLGPQGHHGFFPHAPLAQGYPQVGGQIPVGFSFNPMPGRPIPPPLNQVVVPSPGPNSYMAQYAGNVMPYLNSPQQYQPVPMAAPVPAPNRNQRQILIDPRSRPPVIGRGTPYPTPPDAQVFSSPDDIFSLPFP